VGKSTLASLLLRFYDPDEGQVLLDGIDVRQLQGEQLRSNIGLVLQEPTLFHGSVLDNIRYGKPDATMEEVIAAARVANAHHFLLKLPEGYDSHIGERGVRLSQGEKQRISIARAILRDPPILVLDEATASVDTETERLIQSALDRLVKGRTVIAIAHRLSTLRNADRIIVLSDGRIGEQGSHSELIARRGLYYELCEAQSMLGRDITESPPIRRPDGTLIEPEFNEDYSSEEEEEDGDEY
jgi:ATP-binding cassette subfamily B protein